MISGVTDQNDHYRQILQDWLTESWIQTEQDPTYREALAFVLQSLLPGASKTAGSQKELSYLPLPSLCAYALGSVTPTTTAVNAAWVLLYTASFLLDKIEDEETDHPVYARLRARFGAGAVVNLTTGLVLHAGRILAELKPEDPSAAAALDAARRRFHLAALQACAGQHLDLTLREPDFNEVWKIIDAKSGRFFAMGAFLGARLAVDDAGVVEAFEQVGRRLGILVQIGNDLHGFDSQPGAPSDLAAGKRTLPVLYALQVLPAEERARLSMLLSIAPVDSGAEMEARKMIISAGAIVYLSLEAEKHRQQAIKALCQLGLDEQPARPLLDLLRFAGRLKKNRQAAAPNVAAPDTAALDD